MATVSEGPTSRTTVKRHPERGAYDRETIHQILDEALYCHVATVVDGSPRIIPTIHARAGDTLSTAPPPADPFARSAKARRSASR